MLLPRAWLAPAAAPPAAAPPRRAAFAAVAAVLLAIVIPSISWLLWTRAAGQRALPGLAELPSGDQRRLRATLQAGVAEPPTWLAELAGPREVLLGGSPPPDGFSLVSPMATAVVDDRPRLQWRPLAGATSYTVEVFDDGRRAVASSPPSRERIGSPTRRFRGSARTPGR